MNEQRSFQILDGFILKILGLLFMTFDHIGVFLLMYGSNKFNTSFETFNQIGHIFRIIGRLSLPLFTFLLAEGMNHTHNKNKYLLRLGLLYAITSILQIIIVYGIKGMDGFADQYNPCVDLFFVGLTLYCLSLNGKKKLFSILPIAYILVCYAFSIYEKANDVTIYAWPIFLRPGYSIFNLLIGLGFFYAPTIALKMSKKTNEMLGISDEVFIETKQGRKLINIISSFFVFVVTLILWAISYINASNGHSPYDPFEMGIQSYCLLSLIFIYLYNGKRGYDAKWWRVFSYSYFPMHLAIIFLIFYVIMGY
ncbi:MAG TPA: hypothetical protein DCR94_04820 [Firmicutes bacterium]|nr:hypothetical protein [Bacillota bacterium]